MTDVDRIIKAIKDLPYDQLRVMAMSLNDVLSNGCYELGNVDGLVPILYDWSVGWEASDDEPAPLKAVGG